MENPPFEDVFPIQDGDFPLLCLFTGGYMVDLYGKWRQIIPVPWILFGRLVALALANSDFTAFIANNIFFGVG